MDATARIIGALFELNKVMRHRMAKSGHTHRLNMHQMHALVSVLEHPRCTMKDLARLLHITQASATPLVARLVREQLLRRHTDTKNRKLVRVSLTSTGESELRRAMAGCHQELHSLFSRLPAKDRTLMADILTRLLCSIRASVSAS